MLLFPNLQKMTRAEFESLLFVVAQKIQTPQPCTMCRNTSPISDMVENKSSENVVELFCTKSCVSAFKIQAVNSSGTGRMLCSASVCLI